MQCDEPEGLEGLSVCLAEYNPLAACHLRRILESDPGIRLIPQEDALKPKRFPKSLELVFVVDRGALPFPLSRYLRFLRFRSPQAKILLLGLPIPNDEVCRLLFLGIQGFLPYREVDNHLATAIHAVAQGDFWVTPRAFSQFVRHTAGAQFKDKLGETLSPRERHIIELAHRRLSNKEIGAILGISESTVKFHFSNIFNKLGVHDRLSAVELVTANVVGEVLQEKSRKDRAPRPVAVQAVG